MSRYPLLYLGYGANTNRGAMRHRCPTAVYVGNARLLDFRLIFRSVADVIPDRGRSVVCSAWEIQRDDEAALDRFEGFPSHYGKQYADIVIRGVKWRAMFYVMAGNRSDRHEPPSGYEHTLRVGYRECGMPEAQIDEAIRDSLGSRKRELRYNGGWLGTKAGEKPGKKQPKGAPWVQDALDLAAKRENDRKGIPDWMIGTDYRSLWD
jgi:gamma-glutamylcyclotransferase (GGCT)/AIG2-like uncharacterized protein YtfP